jgi:glycosyltransferase involved in cell wall biosynthesis
VFGRNARQKRSNILLVGKYPSDIGYAWWLMENFWIQIANYFDPRGRRCYLAYPRLSAVPDAIARAPLILRECDFYDRSRSNDISSIYLTDSTYFDFYYFYLRLLGITTIVNHDHTPGDRPSIGGVKGAIKSAVNRAGLPCCDHVICVSEHMKRRSLLNGRIPPKKCITIQNGIVPILCQDKNRRYVKQVFDIPSSAVVVVSTGRAHPYKRIDFVIDVAQHVIKRDGRKDIYFLYCGDGPAMAALRRRAGEYRLGSQFVFGGRRDDIEDILCSSDIALHAAAGEGFSLSILEYMSSGLATLVPDIPSVRQAITDGVTGLTYQADDAGAASALVLSLADGPDRRREVGGRAAVTVREQFSLERCNKHFVSFVSKIL